MHLFHLTSPFVETTCQCQRPDAEIAYVEASSHCSKSLGFGKCKKLASLLCPDSRMQFCSRQKSKTARGSLPTIFS